MEVKELNRWLAFNLIGKKELSQEFMEKTAREVWVTQPQCQSFDSGFYARTEGGKVIAEQFIPNYAGDDKEASKVRQKLLHRFPGSTLSLFAANGEFNAVFSHHDIYYQVAEVKESMAWAMLAQKVLKSSA